jgi:hypothetical protein
MNMAKVHKVTPEEINDLIAKGMTREEAEFALIDKYDEVVFPDETDDINDKLKEQKKIAHVYDKKKGPRKVERKPDEDKRELMSNLVEMFQNYDGFNVVSQEGKLKFLYNNRHFTLTLTWNRKEDKNE